MYMIVNVLLDHTPNQHPSGIPENYRSGGPPAQSSYPCRLSQAAIFHGSAVAGEPSGILMPAMGVITIN